MLIIVHFIELLELWYRYMHSVVVICNYMRTLVVLSA